MAAGPLIMYANMNRTNDSYVRGTMIYMVVEIISAIQINAAK